MERHRPPPGTRCTTRRIFATGPEFTDLVLHLELGNIAVRLASGCLGPLRQVPDLLDAHAAQPSHRRHALRFCEGLRRAPAELAILAQQREGATVLVRAHQLDEQRLAECRIARGPGAHRRAASLVRIDECSSAPGGDVRCLTAGPECSRRRIHLGGARGGRRGDRLRGDVDGAVSRSVQPAEEAASVEAPAAGAFGANQDVGWQRHRLIASVRGQRGRPEARIGVPFP